MWTPAQFWGEVFPGWLGTLAGIAATVIALLAYLKSLRNQAGLQNVATGVNQKLGNQGPDSPGPAVLYRAMTGQYLDDREHSVRWRPVRITNDRFQLVNDSPIPAVVTALANLDAASADRVTPASTLPAQVAGDEGIDFTIRRSFVSPEVLPVRIEWTEHERGPFEATFYL